MAADGKASAQANEVEGVWHSLAFGVLRAVGKLPARRFWGRGLGRLAYALMRERRRVARRNIAAALPDLSAEARRRLLREHFVALGEWFMDSLWSLSAGADALRREVAVEGTVTPPCVLLAPHFLGMDICSLRLSADMPERFFYYYRPQHNAFWDKVTRRQRDRFGAVGLSTRSRHSLLRGVRRLREGGVLCYFPDIDPGTRKSTVFVPFLGIARAATATGVARVAKLASAPAVLAIACRTAGGYCFRLLPLAGFPDDCGAGDAARMNAAIGEWARRQPARYYWLHRRFKTTAGDDPPLYERG